MMLFALLKILPYIIFLLFTETAEKSVEIHIEARKSFSIFAF